MVSTETCRIITNQCGRQQQAAWAASTDHVPLGPMVGANTFRNPQPMPSRRRPSTTSAAGGRSPASVDAG
jgi:hypothetical protein